MKEKWWALVVQNRTALTVFLYASFCTFETHRFVNRHVWFSGFMCLIYGVFTNLQNYGIDQSYVQRYHTAKNEKEAKFSALFGGYLFIPVSAVFFMIGTGLYAFYKVHPGSCPTEWGRIMSFRSL